MEKELRKFEIRLGAASDPIAKQLKKQGFRFRESDIEKCDLIAESITMLSIHGFLTPSLRDKMSQKLMRLIQKAIV